MRHLSTSVLIIGAGGAGMYAAIEAARLGADVLLLDRSLICEVADTSSTSPHLRYAATTDEGGRGLFLVAQLGERWGTRYTKAGKIIWVEQRLPRRGAAPLG